MVGLESPSKHPLQNEAAEQEVDDREEEITIALQQLEMHGVIGPCSYDSCSKFAAYRCTWQNKFKLNGGGCEELFCFKHGYIPVEAKDPICCKDCRQTFINDKKRIKVF